MARTTTTAARPNSTVRGDTWLQAEEAAYPHGGFTRRAYCIIRRNPYNPDVPLPYGELRTVRCSIPDTYFTIPARYKGVEGFVSVCDDGGFTFTPNGKG